MYPVGSTTHWLVVFESFFGLTVLATTAGLLIARLTRPRMRLRFSESAVVAPYEEGRGAHVPRRERATRGTEHVQRRVSVVLYEELGGNRQRNLYRLALEPGTTSVPSAAELTPAALPTTRT